MMNTADYKKIFKSFPQRAWLSSTLKGIAREGKYEDIIDYLTGEKDIDIVNDATELYKIKSKFFMLAIDCKAIIDNIKKLDLDFIGEFDDKKMELSDIGISAGDTFICVNDFLHWDMIQINNGSVIRIKDFQYAGENSNLHFDIVSLNTNETTRRLFPNNEDIKLLLTFKDLEDNFNKQ